MASLSSSTDLEGEMERVSLSSDGPFTVLLSQGVKFK